MADTPPEAPQLPDAAAGKPAPAADPRFGDLAELEQEIRRRLRSNQRFLEKFLDEDFVDDEAGGDDEGADEEEEL